MVQLPSWLASVFGSGSGHAPPGQHRPPPAPGNDYGFNNHDRDLQSTFDLLRGVIKFVVVLTAIWAVAAGFLQAGRLVHYLPQWLPTSHPGYWVTWVDRFGPPLAILVYALKAFGVAMLVALAAAMVGGFLGFLFGVPRPAAGAAASASTAPATPAPGNPPVGAGAPAAGGPGAAGAAQRAAPAAATATARSGRPWQTSTNLTEISDWLTKIIVGVGLVESKAIFEGFTQVSQRIGMMLFDGAVGTQLVIPAMIIVGALVGFLYAYLFTQLVIAGLVARTDAALGGAGAPVAAQTIVPRDVQGRKDEFSDYIQGLVDNNNASRLDLIAQALGIAVPPDLPSKRSSILAEVAKNVNVSDPIAAVNAMDQLSSRLYGITGQNF